MKVATKATDKGEAEVPDADSPSARRDPKGHKRKVLECLFGPDGADCLEENAEQRHALNRATTEEMRRQQSRLEEGEDIERTLAVEEHERKGEEHKLTIAETRQRLEQERKTDSRTGAEHKVGLRDTRERIKRETKADVRAGQVHRLDLAERRRALKDGEAKAPAKKKVAKTVSTMQVGDPTTTTALPKRRKRRIIEVLYGDVKKERRHYPAGSPKGGQWMPLTGASIGGAHVSARQHGFSFTNTRPGNRSSASARYIASHRGATMGRPHVQVEHSPMAAPRRSTAKRNRVLAAVGVAAKAPAKVGQTSARVGMAAAKPPAHAVRSVPRGINALGRNRAVRTAAIGAAGVGLARLAQQQGGKAVFGTAANRERGWKPKGGAPELSIHLKPSPGSQRVEPKLRGGDDAGRGTYFSHPWLGAVQGNANQHGVNVVHLRPGGVTVGVSGLAALALANPGRLGRTIQRAAGFGITPEKVRTPEGQSQRARNRLKRVLFADGTEGPAIRQDHDSKTGTQHPNPALRETPVSIRRRTEEDRMRDRGDAKHRRAGDVAHIPGAHREITDNAERERLANEQHADYTANQHRTPQRLHARLRDLDAETERLSGDREVRRTTKHLQAAVRTEARAASDAAYGDLSSWGTTHIQSPPPKRQTRDTFGRKTYSRGKGGEWDWYDALPEKEHRRLKANGWVRSGARTTVDEMTDMVNSHTGGSGHDAAAGAWLHRTRVVDAGRALGNGRVTTYGIRPKDLSPTLDQLGQRINPTELFGPEGNRAVARMFAERALEQFEREHGLAKMVRMRKARKKPIVGQSDIFGREEKALAPKPGRSGGKKIEWDQFDLFGGATHETTGRKQPAGKTKPAAKPKQAGPNIMNRHMHEELPMAGGGFEALHPRDAEGQFRFKDGGSGGGRGVKKAAVEIIKHPGHPDQSVHGHGHRGGDRRPVRVAPGGRTGSKLQPRDVGGRFTGDGAMRPRRKVNRRQVVRALAVLGGTAFALGAVQSGRRPTRPKRVRQVRSREHLAPVIPIRPSLRAA